MRSCRTSRASNEVRRRPVDLAAAAAPAGRSRRPRRPRARASCSCAARATARSHPASGSPERASPRPLLYARAARRRRPDALPVRRLLRGRRAVDARLAARARGISSSTAAPRPKSGRCRALAPHAALLDGSGRARARARLPCLLGAAVRESAGSQRSRRRPSPPVTPRSARSTSAPARALRRGEAEREHTFAANTVHCKGVVTCAGRCYVLPQLQGEGWAFDLENAPARPVETGETRCRLAPPPQPNRHRKLNESLRICSS